MRHNSELPRCSHARTRVYGVLRRTATSKTARPRRAVQLRVDAAARAQPPAAHGRRLQRRPRAWPLKREQLHLVADSGGDGAGAVAAPAAARACSMRAPRCRALRPAAPRARARRRARARARRRVRGARRRGVLDAFRYPSSSGDAGGDDDGDLNMRSHTDPGLLTITWPPSPACRFATAARGSTPRPSAARARCSCSAARRCRSPRPAATAPRRTASAARARFATRSSSSSARRLRTRSRRSGAAPLRRRRRRRRAGGRRRGRGAFVRRQLCAQQLRTLDLAQVLGEFSVPPEFARPPADADALVTVLIEWVRCCGERDEARRRRAAEHVVFTPAFDAAGCTWTCVPRPG